MRSCEAASAPQALPGFEHIRHFWDSRNECWVAQVHPGQVYLSQSDEIISTVLGSCIAVCVRDGRVGIGGMNHFMLPEDKGHDCPTASARYGLFAMESLINGILRNGGKKSRLELKVFGGGKVISGPGDIGARNIEFALEYFEADQLTVVSKDVGGVAGRQVRYNPKTGRAWVKRLNSATSIQVLGQERQYKKEISSAPIDGGVEFF